MMITLTKHHGLGNDFLVCDTGQLALQRTGGPVTVRGFAPAWPELARRWCDRRRGVGADGLLLLEVLGDDELSLVLHNADGGRAEMSGNGIRCLAQAAMIRQNRSGPVRYKIHTDVGPRFVDAETLDAATIRASVTMGAVTSIDPPKGWAGVGADRMRPVLHLSTGNPHTVVGVEDLAGVDLLGLGSRVAEVNLEIIKAGPEPWAITMRVHERGAGITQACGTGACVSAWAAAAWGLAEPAAGEILVHMDGGDVKVRLNDPVPGQVTLVGPAVFIALLQIESP